MKPIVIDAAGAQVGGAKRYLNELDDYLSRSGRSDVQVVGRGAALTPTWLLAREASARGASQRIAINNASFFGLGGRRVVTLRNALHFASDAELQSLGYRPPRSLRLQVPVIRRLALRADRVIVPCSAMGDRVAREVPGLRSRIEVRMHPVSPRSWATSNASPSAQLLVPILNAPYKRLDRHLSALIQSAADVRELERIVVTADADDFPPALAKNGRLLFVGPLRAEMVDRYWADSRAIYFPTQIESFGYPLAEARANGRRVVAIDSSQNREIAGEALASFRLHDSRSLTAALRKAMGEGVRPDPAPFDPDAYFTDLMAIP